MGVLACDRRACDKVMCDILIAGKWYCCRQCWTELAEVRKEWPDQMPMGDLLDRIEAFFDSPSVGPVGLVNTDEEFLKLVQFQ